MGGKTCLAWDKVRMPALGEGGGCQHWGGGGGDMICLGQGDSASIGGGGGGETCLAWDKVRMPDWGWVGGCVQVLWMQCR